ncbi:phosphatase PAP2 family protein [bacterium]|nr:phosphatase PAP2 family protein [bacterium]
MFSAYNREDALSFAAVIVPSVAINQLVKARFKFPRPPRVAQHPWAYIAPGDFTFPSGHAQNAVVLGMFVAYKARKGWLRVLGVTLATAVPLSRIYLGVHYPRDVITGVLLGLGTVAGVKVLKKPFRRWWDDAPRGPRGFTLAFAFSIAGLLTGTPLAAFPLGVGGGFAVGHDLSGSTRFKLDTPSPRGRIAQGAIGVGVILGAGYAIRPLLKRETPMAAVLGGNLLGVALTFGAPFVTSLARRVKYWRKRKKKRVRR